MLALPLLRAAKFAAATSQLAWVLGQMMSSSVQQHIALHVFNKIQWNDGQEMPPTSVMSR
jgi:uncharacterized membrane protein YdcZ (DUF606 family)